MRGRGTAVGGHRELTVEVAGVTGSHQLLSLNHALVGLVPWHELASSETLEFVAHDGGAVASARLMRDDWDLAIYLRALEALSAARPELRFAISLDGDGDGPSLSLDAGRYADQAAVAGFLARMAEPRPALGSRFDRLTVKASATTGARLRDALCAEAGRFGRDGEVAIAGAGPTLDLVVPLDGSAADAAFWYERLVGAWLTVALGDDGGARCTVELEGETPRAIAVAELIDLLPLRQALAAGAAAERVAPGA